MKSIKYLTITAAFILTVMTGSSFAQSYEFELQDINGNNVKLSSLLDKGPVMMSFWALWCVPCKEEMKEFNGIYKNYKDSGFVYVAINQDSPKSMAKVKSYIESKSYDFLVLLDTDLHVFETYGGQNLPFSVLLNKKGEVAKTYSGYLSGDEKKIEEDILKVIREPK
jgi:cytochrome c biogenesis protein CcmG/thiol:disulfide interchange protein DsbE